MGLVSVCLNSAGRMNFRFHSFSWRWRNEVHSYQLLYFSMCIPSDRFGNLNRRASQDFELILTSISLTKEWILRALRLCSDWISRFTLSGL